MTIKSILAAAAAIAASTAAASAGVIVEFRFDVPGPGSSSYPLPVTLGGVTADASCLVENGSACSIVQSAVGLGVKQGILNPGDIDGSDAAIGAFSKDEQLFVMFDSLVRLVRVDFEKMDDTGDADESALIVDGVEIGYGTLFSGLGGLGAADCSFAIDDDPFIGRECEVSFADLPAFVGTSFGFGDGFAFDIDGDDNYRIESLVVEILDVAEPGALALLGLGLAGLGAIRRRA